MADTTAPVDDFVRRARELYSLPAVALKVLELTDHPKVDVRALKECIETDPALTVRLLRVVNSSVFGMSREVRDLNQALALLGIKPLKLLVLGFSLPEGLWEGVEDRILTRYWTRSLTKAVAAREIAETFWRLPGDEAFIAGLLQEVGVLALLQDLGEPYAKLLDKTTEMGMESGPLEESALGFRQSLLGARLLEHWGLAADLVQAVEHAETLTHIPDERITSAALNRVLCLAHNVATFLGTGSVVAWNNLSYWGREWRQITDDDWARVLQSLQKRVESLADILKLPVNQNLDYPGVLTKSRERLASLAADAAVDLAKHESEKATREHLRDTVDDVARAARSGTPRPSARNKGPSPVSVGTAIAPMTSAMPPRPTAAPAHVDENELVARVASAVQRCRLSRQPLSLLLFSIGPYDLGTSSADSALLKWSMEEVLERCGAYNLHDCAVFPVGSQNWAGLLPGCERSTAARIGQEFIHEFQERHVPRRVGPATTVSVGAATVDLPSKNFPARELVDSARRCLDVASRSGGNQLKSIGVY